MDNSPSTAFLERRDDGWVLAIALPAETAIVALEMIDELLLGLSPTGSDSDVAAAAGSLVGLLNDLRVRTSLDAVRTARAAA